MVGKYISVHILDVPYQADCEYTYFVPSHLCLGVKRGRLAVVPFGKSNRRHTALIVKEDVEYSSEAKEIFSLINSYFSLSEEMIELCYFMKRQTLCTIGEAVKCQIPISLITKTKELLSVTDKGTPKEERELYSYICENPNSQMSALK